MRLSVLSSPQTEKPTSHRSLSALLLGSRAETLEGLTASDSLVVPGVPIRQLRVGGRAAGPGAHVEALCDGTEALRRDRTECPDSEHRVSGLKSKGLMPGVS